MFTLRRVSDGAGDSGPMSDIIWLEDGEKRVVHSARPQIGALVRVGSYAGRTFARQDYWTTTFVTEILSDTPNEVRFRTRNSEYVWTTTDNR